MSSGASFVKRSKPRSSASRISSTYDDGEDATGPSRAASASNGSTVAAGSRKILSSLDPEDEDDAGASNVVFRARARGGRGTPSTSSAGASKAVAAATDRSSTPSQKQRSTISAMDEDEDADGGDAFEIRRSKLSMAGKEARRSGLSSQTSGSTSTPKRTSLRPTAFQAASDTTAESTPSASNLYTSKYLEELRSATPTSRSRAQSPAAPSTGPGLRIDDPMVTQTSRMALSDLDADDALARSKFPADFAHGAIPTESAIRAAKEKRAKLRAAAAAGEDYISLAPSSSLKVYSSMEVDDGPHPHSRLQREEDEYGDGEEEFAEYTGATERIPIGEKAEEEWRERQRREMQAAVQGDVDDEGMALPGEEMDEDEEEWERAQLRRTQVHPHSSREREKSPFRPAPIPAATPLPSTSTCSTRLQLTLRVLEQSAAASEAVVASTEAELAKLDAAERENELDVDAMEDKASWYSEFDEFVASLARFMAEKKARVDEVEKEALDLLVRRTRLVARRRERWFEAQLGVKLPVEVVTVSGDGLPDEAMEPNDEGEAVYPSKGDELSTADEASFRQAQEEILSTLTAIFADVQAAEYLDPAATSSSDPTLAFLSTSSPQDNEMLHPRSVVARFKDWRRRYRDEYAQVWGGLSLAQIWEFYARLELIPWDPAPFLSRSWKSSLYAVEDMRWFRGASDYASAADGEVMGGDDEMLSSLVANVLVDKLLAIVRSGAFDVWSGSANNEAVSAVEMVQRVLGIEHARCVGLIEAYLETFKHQIERFALVLGPNSGSVPARAADKVAEHLVDELLENLLCWDRIVSITSAEGPMLAVSRSYMRLKERLVDDVILPFFRANGLEGSPVEERLRTLGKR